MHKVPNGPAVRQVASIGEWLSLPVARQQRGKPKKAVRVAVMCKQRLSLNGVIRGQVPELQDPMPAAIEA